MAVKLPGCVVPVEIAGLTEGFQLRPDRFFSRVTVDLWRELKVALQPLPPPEARLALNEDMTGCLGVCTCDVVIDNAILRNHSMLVSRESPSLGLISLVDSKLIYDFGRGMVFRFPENDSNRSKMMEPRHHEEMRRDNNSQRLDSRTTFSVMERQNRTRNGLGDFYSPNELQPDLVDPRILIYPELERLNVAPSGPEFLNKHRPELLGDRMGFPRGIRLESRMSRLDGPKAGQPRFALPIRNPVHGNLQNTRIDRNNFEHLSPNIQDNPRRESKQPIGIPMQSPKKMNFPNHQELWKKKRIRRRKPAQINRVADAFPQNSGTLMKSSKDRQDISGQVMKVFDDRLQNPGEIMNVFDDRPLPIEEQKKLNEKSPVSELPEKNTHPAQGNQRNNLKRPGDILIANATLARSRQRRSNHYCDICNIAGHTTLRCRENPIIQQNLKQKVPEN